MVDEFVRDMPVSSLESTLAVYFVLRLLLPLVATSTTTTNSPKVSRQKSQRMYTKSMKKAKMQIGKSEVG